MTDERMLRDIQSEAAYGDHMANMARYWMERAQRQEREYIQALAGVILAVGGEVRLSLSDLEDARRCTLERWEETGGAAMVFRVREKS